MIFNRIHLLRSLIRTIVIMSAINPAYALEQVCKIQDQASREDAEQAKRELRLHENTKKEIDALHRLMDSRSWKPNASMASQMSSTETANFTLHQQQIKSLQLAVLVESKRSRDIHVIARLARTADETARYGFELPTDKKSEEYMLKALLFALKQLQPIKIEEIQATLDSDQCDLEAALVKESKKAIAQADKVDGAANAMKDFERYATKYPAMDVKSMSAADRQYYEANVLPIVSEIKAQLELAKDLLRLAKLEHLSKLMVEARRQDEYEAPGDIDYSGHTWKEWVKDGKITPEENDQTRILNLINEKFPSDFIKELDKSKLR